MSQHLSPSDLQTRLNAVTVVDVRQPMEVAGGRIPGSRCIPLDRLERAELPDGDLVFVCASGNRSAQAMAVVQQRFPARPVMDLAGGLERWKARGCPLNGRPELPCH